MKTYLWGIALFIVAIATHVHQVDYSCDTINYENLKFVADEAAATAALFYDKKLFSNGYKVFNQETATKAAEYIIRKNLSLDETFNPLTNSYWKDTVSYDIYFYDNSNTTFPDYFIDNMTGYEKTITEPIVIISINAGRANYNLAFLDEPIRKRCSAYSYEDY